MSGFVMIDEARKLSGPPPIEPAAAIVMLGESPLDRMEAHIVKFEAATRNLRRVFATIRRRHPHVVRKRPRSRVYRNWNGTVRRKDR